jgi:hypothetical protein
MWAAKDSANSSEITSEYSGQKAQKLSVAPLHQFIVGCRLQGSTFLQYSGLHGKRDS